MPHPVTSPIIDLLRLERERERPLLLLLLQLAPSSLTRTELMHTHTARAHLLPGAVTVIDQRMKNFY